jgi:hypothetical protein
LTVQGSLAFQSGAVYLVQVDPVTASLANATSATLGGATVYASFAAGSYVVRQYLILHTTSGITDTFGAVTGNTPGNVSSSLSYDANNAYLNLALSFSVPGGLNTNQQNVASALTNFFNTNGGIPGVYTGLSSNGLSQSAGETATGSQQTTFNAMTQFMA